MRKAAATRLMGAQSGWTATCSGGAIRRPVNVIRLRTYKDSLYDLLTAYAADRVRRLGG